MQRRLLLVGTGAILIVIGLLNPTFLPITLPFTAPGNSAGSSSYSNPVFINLPYYATGTMAGFGQVITAGSASSNPYGGQPVRLTTVNNMPLSITIILSWQGQAGATVCWGLVGGTGIAPIPGQQWNGAGSIANGICQTETTGANQMVLTGMVASPTPATTYWFDAVFSGPSASFYNSFSISLQSYSISQGGGGLYQISWLVIIGAALGLVGAAWRGKR